MKVFDVFIMALGIYTLGNGILHDIFVLRAHKEPYDRNLLRLMMDGHILITSGLLYMVAFFLLRQNNVMGLYLCLVVSVGLIVYCLMIFPFLKSFFTLALNSAVLVITLVKLFFA